MGQPCQQANAGPQRLADEGCGTATPYWVPIISFSSKAVRDKWSGAIIEALRQAYPEALL